VPVGLLVHGGVFDGGELGEPVVGDDLDAAQRLAVAIHTHREACIQEGVDRCHCRSAAVQ
jgi:hypothetical protein